LYKKDSDTQYTKWDTETYNLLTDGTNGIGSYTINLSNDYASIPCNKDGSFK